ncbi:hypothetical protein C5O78_02500 [Treponema phagedenis]|nr:hypothetical protein C5O78_02500 [Treponema phagedenis]
MRRVKLRTGTNARGSNRNDVLKQKYLQSFQTRRFGFDKDVKTQNNVKRCLKTTTAYSEFLNSQH